MHPSRIRDLKMKRVNLITIVASIISILIVVSCGQKQVDKSLYEFIALKDAGTGTIKSSNVNETKLYVSKVKYCNLPESIKTAIGLSKGGIAFADPETDVITPFSVKGNIPDLKDGQNATIYFRLIRNGGRVDKLKIDLIETN